MLSEGADRERAFFDGAGVVYDEVWKDRKAGREKGTGEDQGVDLRRRKGLVPEGRLDVPHVDAPTQKVDSQAEPEAVGRDARDPEPRTGGLDLLIRHCRRSGLVRHEKGVPEPPDVVPPDRGAAALEVLPHNL